MQTVAYHDLELIDFKECWDIQENLLNDAVNRKLQNRNLSPEEQISVQHHLLFCEHPHVFTLGKSGHDNHLLINDQFLQKINATYFHINRGGDITYHGPGQLVGYPILDLDFFFNDIHRYLRFLEEVVILTMADYGLKGGRIAGLTGVWLNEDDPKRARKICAFGVRCSRWVTMHGFALNVNTDLTYFDHIIPCGIKDKAVTSLKKELGYSVDINEVKEKMKMHFSNVFSCNIVQSAHHSIKEQKIII